MPKDLSEKQIDELLEVLKILGREGWGTPGPPHQPLIPAPDFVVAACRRAAQAIRQLQRKN